MKWKLSLVVISAVLVSALLAYLLFNPEKYTLDDTLRQRLGGTYIRLSQGITHYRLEGPGHAGTVVLVHGATIPIWTWDGLAEDLQAVGFRVLSYDAFGRGYSDRPRVAYDQALLKGQLLELVNALNLSGPFDLVGLSLGAATAVNFTAGHPDRVRRLVLIQPLINDFKTPSFFRIPVLGEFMGRFFGVRTIAKRFASQVEGHPSAETYTRLFMEQATFKGFERSLLSMLRNDAVRDYTAAYRTVGKQSRDVLLIWGDRDPEITRGMVDRIRSLMPHIVYQPVENAAHGIVFQRPEEVNRLVHEFLLR